MRKNRNYKTEPYLIAYFDILGYKDIVMNEDFEEAVLIEIIDEVVNSVKRTENLKFPENNTAKVYCFSDNFLICISKEPQKLYIERLAMLIEIMQIIQTQFFSRFGLLIRGCIIEDVLYLGEDYVFGKGIINAYLFEDNKVIYPRIIIDTNLVDTILEDIISTVKVLENNKVVAKGITTENMFDYYFKACMKYGYAKGIITEEQYNTHEDDYDLIIIKKDFDDYYFVDYLQYLHLLDRYPEDVPVGDKDDELEGDIVDAYYEGYGMHMFRNLYKYKSIPHVFEKYLWSCKYAESFFNEFGFGNTFTKDIIKEIIGINIDEITTNIKL